MCTSAFFENSTKRLAKSFDIYITAVEMSVCRSAWCIFSGSHCHKIFNCFSIFSYLAETARAMATAVLRLKTQKSVKKI